MNLLQLGLNISQRRQEIGLLQEHLARLTGISRVTINKLENGALPELGFTKISAIMDTLGLDMTPVKPTGITRGLVLAARSVSTSFREVLSPEMLYSILRTGQTPHTFQPHMMTLLDETPVPVVLKAVSEASTIEVPVKKIMKHLHNWAEEWKVCRKIW